MAYLRKHHATKNSFEIAEAMQCSRVTIMRYAKQLGISFKKKMPKIAPKVLIQEDKKKIADLQNKKIADLKYKTLLSENEKLQKQLNMATSLPKIGTHIINPTKPIGENEATAVIVASDWHLGEVIRPQQVNGLNEFNPVIAKLRVEEFFKNSVRLIDVFSKDIEINTVILALIGDFINNTIHDDAKETNSMSQTAEVEFTQNLICSGLQYMLDNTTCNFIIPCKSGNHSRTSEKNRVANEQGVSLEYLMYMNISRYFRHEARFNFIIEEGYHTIIDVYNMKLRFHHGHDIRYAGGIGGLTIPANKAIAQWNKSINCDIDIFGHFHSYFMGGNFVANGSIVGFNAFAIAIKASFEKPKQAFFLIDKKRGMTISTPIYFSQ